MITVHNLKRVNPNLIDERRTEKSNTGRILGDLGSVGSDTKDAKDAKDAKDDFTLSLSEEPQTDNLPPADAKDIDKDRA